RVRGLKQEELAERAGVSADIIRKLEQGARTSARLKTLTALAGALGVRAGELIDPRSGADGHQGDGVTELARTDIALMPARSIGGEMLRAWRRSRGWDVPEMERRLRQAAGDEPVSAHDALVRMIRRWES